MNQHVFEFDTGVASDRGKVREVNEDSWYTNPASGLWLVADGMGGHTNGQLASQIIAKCAATVGLPASAPDLLARFTDRMHRANDDLVAYAQAHDNLVIGSTLVAILVFGNHYACVWAGDSRAYLVRGMRLVQVSNDHTEVQDLIERGLLTREEAKHYPRRNVITRAVGVDLDLELDTVHGQALAGDRFLLCSDGLTGYVSDDEICDVVSAYSPQEACERLIEMTLERGAGDNVTVVVTHCRDSSAPESGGTFSPVAGAT
jgi:protein phosphatase